MMDEELKIVSLAVLCQLSDGTYHSILTDRATEAKILHLVRDSEEDNLIKISDKILHGVTIEIPDGAQTLCEYLDDRINKLNKKG